MICMLLTEHIVRVCQYWTYVRLRLIDGDVGVDCAIMAQGLIGFDRTLIPLRYTFFSESSSVKNFGVKRVWLGAISGWVTDREVFPGVYK
jgi:hypothetical protein